MSEKTNFSIKKFVKEQSSISILKFITCGNVDDGKST